jgi:hypothetical protein
MGDQVGRGSAAPSGLHWIQLTRCSAVQDMNTTNEQVMSWIFDRARSLVTSHPAVTGRPLWLHGSTTPPVGRGSLTFDVLGTRSLMMRARASCCRACYGNSGRGLRKLRGEPWDGREGTVDPSTMGKTVALWTLTLKPEWVDSHSFEGIDRCNTRICACVALVLSPHRSGGATTMAQFQGF